MSEPFIRRASLAEIKAMKAQGEIKADSRAEPGEELPPGFWDNALMVDYSAPTSVHLKLDPLVFAYFKSKGKGHLTRMQNVLKAYVLAQMAEEKVKPPHAAE